MRQWIDLTNEAQHCGIHEVSLERAEDKSSVDRPDLVCSSLKQGRPSAVRSAVEMYVTMDSAIGSVLPRFKGL